jgi:hypothetical protein
VGIVSAQSYSSLRFMLKFFNNVFVLFGCYNICMNKFTFSINALFSEAWELFKKRPVFLILFVVLFSVLGNISSGVNDKNTDASVFSLTISLISGVLSVIVGAGFTKSMIRYARGDYHQIQIFDLFSVLSMKTLLHYFIFSLVLSIATVIGFIFFIVPGIYILTTYGFGTFLIIDKNISFSDAARLSAVMTKGIKMQIFLLALGSFGLMLLGMLALVVGIFVALPVIFLASTLLYVKAVKFYELAASENKTIEPELVTQI